ncbi:CidA/LrgA family protein [Acinetobacter sp. SM34]|nr:CidA/LrgA family protein [Acinetobacter sp. SM34]MCG2608402.1 CidA/LrgA family protein [Acinetobacter sp. SM34]
MAMSQRYSHFLLIVLQLCILIAIWFLGSVIQHAFNLPISAGVIGLLLLLAALLTGFFKVQWVKTGTDFILAELVLLFIPCVVGLVKYKNLFLAQGWQLVLAVVLGTLCVMVITAYSVHLGFKIESRLKQRQHSQEATMLKHGE